MQICFNRIRQYSTESSNRLLFYSILQLWTKLNYNEEWAKIIICSFIRCVISVLFLSKISNSCSKFWFKLKSANFQYHGYLVVTGLSHLPEVEVLAATEVLRLEKQRMAQKPEHSRLGQKPGHSHSETKFINRFKP